MANVLDRLTSTFDVSKFGSDITLSEKSIAFLNTNPIKVSSWAKSDLANGTINRTDFFVNPVVSYISSITSNVNSIISLSTYDTANSYPLAITQVRNLANSSNNLINQLNLFLDHTNRISGVSDDILDTSTGGLKPNYQSCVGTGGILLTITANTDNVRNASPMLNQFTSLYINDDLNSNSWNIGNSKNSMTTIPSSLTPTQIESINVQINAVNTFIYQRRIEDENYFYESQQIINDFQILNSLQNAGSTERNLINSKIGTTKLKNSIGS
jgi:hypothetical protein